MSDFTWGLATPLINDFFDYDNPADEAQPFLNQIKDTITPYYTPYIDAGRNTLNTLQQQFQSLISNPSGLMTQIGQGYQESPGYRFKVNEATNAANQAAAAAGMLGTPAEQQELARTVSGFADDDFYNYLNTAMRNYFGGLSGMGGINEMGFNASKGLSDDLAASLLTQAKLAYSGKQNENESEGGALGGLLSAAGSIASFF